MGRPKSPRRVHVMTLKTPPLSQYSPISHPPFPQFFRLPPEIRIMIYRIVLAQDEPGKSPAMLQALKPSRRDGQQGKPLYDEALRVYFAIPSNRFTLTLETDIRWVNDFANRHSTHFRAGVQVICLYVCPVPSMPNREQKN
jgi:hypothetical protein